MSASTSLQNEGVFQGLASSDTLTRVSYQHLAQSLGHGDTSRLGQRSSSCLSIGKDSVFWLRSLFGSGFFDLMQQLCTGCPPASGTRLVSFNAREDCDSWNSRGGSLLLMACLR